MEEQLASADGYVARIKFDDVVLYLERPVRLVVWDLLIR